MFNLSSNTVPLTDLERVCKLPTESLLTPDEMEELSEFFILSQPFKEGYRLLEEQANMLYQYINNQGLIGSASAGSGKTLTSLLIANLAFSRIFPELSHRKVMLMVPSKLIPQLKANIMAARRKINFVCPVYFFADCKLEDRIKLANSDKEGLYILGYGFLSSKYAEDLLNGTKPTLIIADEAHKISKKSARRNRVVHYLKNNIGTKLVILSGTFINKSLMELHCLGKYALKDKLPIPLPEHQAFCYSEALNSSNPYTPTDKIRMCKPLIDWAGLSLNKCEKPSEMLEVVREAHYKRLQTSPGVFLSTKSKVNSSLSFSIEFGEMKCPKIEEYIKNVTNSWETPDGQEFETALEKFKWLQELNNGFYNELRWPDEHEKLSEAKICHSLEKLTKSLIRKFIQEKHRPGLDTPLLIRSNMTHHGSMYVGSELYEAWKEWKAFKAIENLPERISRFVRVSDEKIKKTLISWIDFDKDKKGGVIWYQRIGHGEWLYEVFKEYFGDRVLLVPRGSDLTKMCESNKIKNKILILSINSFGTGVDGLQKHFNKMMYASDFNNVIDSEQSIARLHRTGQCSDTVDVRLISCSEFDDMKLAGILQDNYYLHTTLGQRRVFCGGWENKPKTFEQSYLLDQGVDLQNRLTEIQLKDMEEVTG